MAAYTQTAASVIPSSSAEYGRGIAGATILAGQPVYIDTGDSNKIKVADTNAASPAYVVCGLAAHGASAGQPIAYVTSDPDFTHGLTSAVVGDVLVLGSTAGAINPAADLATGWYTQVLGVVTSSTKAIVKIISGTAAHA